MALSTQAYVLIVVYALCILIGMIMTIKTAIQNKSAKGIVAYIISLIITLLLITLIVYDTNCLTAGQCNTWSWVRTSLYVILPIISLILATIALATSFKEPRNTQQQQQQQQLS